MSKLNTLLSVANVGISAANWSKLEGMQRRQMESAARQAAIEVAKNAVFSLKRSAEEALAEEEKHPELTAARLRLLQSAIEQLGIGPQIFPDLADKEYADKTVRLINENSKRVNDSLSEDERANVSAAIDAIHEAEDYEFFIENADEARSLINAERTVRQLSSRNSCLAKAGVLFSIVLVFVITAQALTALGADGSGGIFIGGVITLVAALGITNWTGGRRYQKSKQLLKDSDFDLDRYRKIENRYSLNSVDQAWRLKVKAEKKIEAFFGTEKPLLSTD